MKTQLLLSIPVLSMTAVMLGACGMPAEFGDEHALRASALSSATPHCVARMNSRGPESADPPSAIQAEPAPMTCFGTFAEATSFATGGSVKLPADARPESLTDEQLSPPSLTATYVLGVVYADSGFRGGSLSFTDTSTCASGSKSRPHMPSEWNDKVSSARAFAGCNHFYLYQHSSYDGARIDCGTECRYVGDAMNDRTSSVKLTK